MEWYIVNTFSGYENSVKRALEERIKNHGLDELFDDILVPSEEVTERRGKRTIKVKKKFFPGYLFVRMDATDNALSLINNTPKVSGFVGAQPGKKPRPVPQAQIDKMLGKAQPQEEVEEVVPDVDYEVGAAVRVKSGAFANFQGEVVEVNNEKRKLRLSVSIFGRPTPVEVDFTEVEPVENAS